MLPLNRSRFFSRTEDCLAGILNLFFTRFLDNLKLLTLDTRSDTLRNGPNFFFERWREETAGLNLFILFWRLGFFDLSFDFLFL